MFFPVSLQYFLSYNPFDILPDPFTSTYFPAWKSLVNQSTSTKTRPVSVPKMGFPYSYCSKEFSRFSWAIFCNAFQFLSLFRTKGMKTNVRIRHTAVKKVVDFDSVSFKESVEIFFSLTLVFIRKEARKVEGTNFPLSLNFDSFLECTDSYFSFC